MRAEWAALRGREAGDRGGLRRRHQRLHRLRRWAPRAPAPRVHAARLPPRALDDGGCRCDPQPRPQPQPRQRGHAGAGRVRPASSPIACALRSRRAGTAGARRPRPVPAGGRAQGGSSSRRASFGFKRQAAPRGSPRSNRMPAANGARAATTGSSRRRSPRPGGRCSRTTRTATTWCRASATSSTSGAPTLRAIGANETHLPGISIGHRNESIAFGYTIFPIDQEDLYVYATRGAAPGSTATRAAGNRSGRARADRRARRGALSRSRVQPPRPGHLRRQEVARAFAVRTAQLEPGTATYMGALRHLKARSLPEFEQSIARWGALLNHLYADVGGTIRVAAGRVQRHGDRTGTACCRCRAMAATNGTAAGRGATCARRQPAARLPDDLERDEPAGRLPERVAQARLRVGGTMAAPAHRGVLASLRRVSLDDSLKLQTDVVSLPARRVLPVIARLKAPEGDAARAAAFLKGLGRRARGALGASGALRSVDGAPRRALWKELPRAEARGGIRCGRHRRRRLLPRAPRQ